jgi:hypothetical protein
VPEDASFIFTTLPGGVLHLHMLGILADAALLACSARSGVTKKGYHEHIPAISKHN